MSEATSGSLRSHSGLDILLCRSRERGHMRYRAFHFENYKGIESMDLALSGDVTTLIGLNESGKTTILEAIFCFSYGAEDLDALDPGMATLREPESWIP